MVVNSPENVWSHSVNHRPLRQAAALPVIGRSSRTVYTLKIIRLFIAEISPVVVSTTVQSTVVRQPLISFRQKHQLNPRIDLRCWSRHFA